VVLQHVRAVITCATSTSSSWGIAWGSRLSPIA
jgi:hypothetical protein